MPRRHEVQIKKERSAGNCLRSLFSEYQFEAHNCSKPVRVQLEQIKDLTGQRLESGA